MRFSEDLEKEVSCNQCAGIPGDMIKNKYFLIILKVFIYIVFTFLILAILNNSNLDIARKYPITINISGIVISWILSNALYKAITNN